MSHYSNILTYLLLGHPKETVDYSGRFQTFVYRGPTATLAANTPSFNDDWNGVPVLRTVGPYQLEASTISELVIDTRTPDFAAIAAAGLAAIGSPEFPLYEVEEVQVEKSLRRHPVWATATAAMWNSMDLWIAETDSDARAAFQYWKRTDTGVKTGTVQTLSTTNSPTKNMQDFAALYLQGIENFNDYLPIARKTDLYLGQDLPTVGAIGTRIGAVGTDPFTGVPSGYEWVLTAYRRSKQGRGFYWTVVREWTGALKVKVDATAIY